MSYSKDNILINPEMRENEKQILTRQKL